MFPLGRDGAKYRQTLTPYHTSIFKREYNIWAFSVHICMSKTRVVARDLTNGQFARSIDI